MIKGKSLSTIVRIQISHLILPGGCKFLLSAIETWPILWRILVMELGKDPISTKIWYLSGWQVWTNVVIEQTSCGSLLSMLAFSSNVFKMKVQSYRSVWTEYVSKRQSCSSFVQIMNQTLWVSISNWFLFLSRALAGYLINFLFHVDSYFLEMLIAILEYFPCPRRPSTLPLPQHYPMKFSRTVRR